MDPYALKKCNQARSERKAALLLTDLGDGRDRCIIEGEPVAGALGEALAGAFKSGKSGIHTIEGREFFLNVYLPSVRIVVIGAVHISQALLPMAKQAGFEVEIIDPRGAFATAERFPQAVVHADWPQDILPQKPLDPWCALVAVTHDPKIDDPALIAALEAQCFYIGALGSRKTHGRRVDRLLQAGKNKAEIDQIKAPIGLDIGAASPAEIAVSILAEIILALRGPKQKAAL